MVDVRLPFLPEWRPLVLSGRKTTTVRTKRFGAAGDRFEVDGVPFVLTRVASMSLGDARDRFFREEGFDTPHAFEASWARLHPTRGFDAAHTVWVHAFTRGDDAE